MLARNLRRFVAELCQPAQNLRRSDADTPEPGRTPANPDNGSAAAATPRRSASTLRTLTKDVEKQMRKLDKQRSKLADDLAALAGTDDHQRLAAVGHELAEVESAIGAAEDEWLALAAEAEG